MKALIAAAGLVLTGTPAFAQDASVTFTFEVGAPTGQVMVALFDSEAAYDGDGAPVRQAMIEVTGPTAEVRFADLPAGPYAARMFHDVDGDGQMAVNPFGLPTEPYGFSNNAVGNMGPASWERARFTVAGDTAQTIDLAH